MTAKTRPGNAEKCAHGYTRLGEFVYFSSCRKSVQGHVMQPILFFFWLVIERSLSRVQIPCRLYGITLLLCFFPLMPPASVRSRGGPD